MPPRYAYWTILVDDQPTAFRAGSQDDLMPTFKRLQQKHASAKMMWWQNGKLWDSRLDAQEAMRARGEMGRARDFRQRAPRQELEGERRDLSGKLEWKPKGSGADRPKPEWLTRSTPPRERKPRFEKRANARPKPVGRPSKGRRFEQSESTKLEWKPKSDIAAPKRKWIPKEEFKKSQGIEARRDKNWRPGGEHKDPRQKYKDAKKAKWTRFKQNVRKNWEAKPGRKKKGEA